MTKGQRGGILLVQSCVSAECNVGGLLSNHVVSPSPDKCGWSFPRRESKGSRIESQTPESVICDIGLYEVCPSVERMIIIVETHVHIFKSIS